MHFAFKITLQNWTPWNWLNFFSCFTSAIRFAPNEIFWDANEQCWFHIWNDIETWRGKISQILELSRSYLSLKLVKNYRHRAARLNKMNLLKQKYPKRWLIQYWDAKTKAKFSWNSLLLPGKDMMMTINVNKMAKTKRL